MWKPTVLESRIVPGQFSGAVMPFKDPGKRKAYHKAYRVIWREKNRERENAMNAEYRRTHLELGRQIAKRYAQNHPDRMRVNWRKKAERRKAERLINPDRLRAEEMSVRMRYRARHPERVLVAAAKQRAKLFGLPFDLTESDIEVPETCPVLGIKLVRTPGAKGRANHAAPSLDKVIPELGYIKGNVQVISNRANHLKSDATLEELELVVAYIKRATNCL